MKENSKNKKYVKDYIYYISYLIFGVYFRFQNITFNIEIGDFGKLIPALFFSITVVALKWIPWLSVVGLLLTSRKEQMEDFTKVYMVFTLIVLVNTIITLYLI